MSNIKKSITEFVGHTPLMELVNYEKKHGLEATLLAKLEYLNPAGSIKDRAALNMIEAAEREGLIKPGDTIVENTSGNTGIGLAAFAAAKGYKLEVFLENGASREREQLLEAYGAKLMHYVDLPGMRKMLEAGCINAAKFLQEIYDYCDAQEGNYFFINQVLNENNPGAHIKTTGPEIWEDTDGNVDILVCMVGTAGTITGIGSYLRGKNPNLRIVGVQPAEESRITPEHPNVNIIDGVVAFNGIPQESMPPFLKEGSYDECIDIKTEDAYEVARELATGEGLFIGTSSAAAALAATIVAKRPENKGKNIVVIMPDNGMKYLSTDMFSKP